MFAFILFPAGITLASSLQALMKTRSMQKYRSGLKVNITKILLIITFVRKHTFEYKGTLRFTKEFTTILDPVLDGNGLLILGQEQDTFGGGFDKFQSFSGKISQVNMFQRWVGHRRKLSILYFIFSIFISLFPF